MEVKLEVLLSSSIKRKKPWPRFCWLGREKEGVFLLDDSRISEIHLSSGRSRKKIPKLQTLLPQTLTMSASPSGRWLAGLLWSGEIFLWNKDRDSLKTVSAVPELQQLLSVIKGSRAPPRVSLLVSEDAQRVFLASVTGQVFLWECVSPQDLSGPRDASVTGRWSQISAPEDTRLPSDTDKEASAHCVFVRSQAVGDVCLCAFVFTSEAELIVTLLKIQWDSTWDCRISAVGFSVVWVWKSFPLQQLQPPCVALRSRGALVPALAPDGQMLALVLNQREPRATQVLFISTLNFVTLSCPLGGCGVKTPNIPAKYARSYWVCSVSWDADALRLACVLKRGSLLMLARLAGLVPLSTSGCSVEFSAAHFLPLHPLITCRAPAGQTEAGGTSSSSVSLRDALRQRYSVTFHPRQPLIIVSDGYMVTVMRVRDGPSAGAMVSSLLQDAARGLEELRGALRCAQPQLRSRLDSLSTLTFTGSLQALRKKETPLSTLPLYLQDTGDTQHTERAQEEDEDGDSDEGLCLRSRLQDGGRLEFASMFDTLHAPAHMRPKPQEEVCELHRKLLTAWALGVSVEVEQRERLLRFTVVGVSRLIDLIRLRDASWADHALHTLRTLLRFLPWDAWSSTGRGCPRSCLRVTLDLTRAFVDVFLPSDSSLSSRNFSTALLVLQEASESLDHTYSLTPRAVHHGKDEQLTYASDMFSVPALQEETEAETQTAPSHRLVFVWREVYRRALQYQDELRLFKGGVKQELEKMSVIIPQIQQTLQSAGDRLEESHALRSFTGEEHFIVGEYTESLQVWSSEVCAERDRAGPMACVLESRCGLALLYAQLYQYRLRDAQALCDRLARKLHPHLGPEEEETQGHTDGDVGSAVGREAACAVLQSLGRFMAAYFTNRPLFILPPHNVDVLPPLHLPQHGGVRLLALSRPRVAAALRSQQLSDVWTVDFALELLLLAGLFPEAVWMARALGDWKMAVALGLAYSEHVDISRLCWRELHLPSELRPAGIFQDQLKLLLERMNGDANTGDVEDVALLQLSLQDVLKACVMVEVDVVSQPLTRLMDEAKERAAALPALVPPALYLPAPPLYCPQPSPNTQDSFQDSSLLQEWAVRSQVSRLLLKALLLLRASHVSRPAARWYISGLQRCRHTLLKKQKKASEPRAELIPDGLKKFSAHPGFFQSEPRDVDGVTAQILTCFRELCALCWMLHVRDRLSISCRKYQTARKQETDTQVSVSDLCVEALCWARRLLPFCRFLNAEEVLQDLVLSLLSELPPSHMTAETLARVFPEELECVRVPLREKYTSLLQRLRATSGPDSKSAAAAADEPREEDSGTMMLLLQDELRRHRRDLQRVRRCVCEPELYLWERDEEEDRGAHASILKHLSLSLGTSLSDSTLTDAGRPLVYSEGDTAETLSEPALSPEPQSKAHTHSSQTAKTLDAPNKSTHDRKKSYSEKTASPVPTVGSWEFEREDNEYTLFLDLFLSCVLEKAGPGVGLEAGPEAEEAELPLLRGFCAQLRSRELHSASFDLLSVLRRRQRDGQRKVTRAPLFRAGYCFQTLPDPPQSSAEPDHTQADTDATSASALPGMHAGKPQGLFGLRQHAALQSGVSSCQSFRTVPQADVDVQVQLDSSLEARFPRLARLLEWMMRWADRRLLLSHPLGTGSDAGVMRVRGSTPAVLFALQLLERRYSAALLEENTHHSPSQRCHQGAEFDAPLLQPITGRRRGHERSVGSEGTPITLPERDVPSHSQSQDSDGEAEDQMDEDTLMSNEQENVTAIRGEITYSPEGESSVAEVTEASWTNQSRAHRDQALTLADLESSDTDEHSSHSQSEENRVSSGANRPEISASVDESGVSPSVIPEPLERQRDPHPAPSEAQIQINSHPAPTEAQTRISSHLTPDEAQTQSDPVRQLLQDELFRLVQLQQLNFMSLMQVVGASFANLPLSQVNMLQSAVTLAQNTPAPPQPSSQNAQHTERDDTSHPTQALRPERTQDTSDQHRHPLNVNTANQMEQRHAPLQTQEMEQLTIRSDWPEDGQTSGRSFIPTSHGLLTTANQHAALPASSNETRAAPVTPGLRLLKLRPPAPRPVKEAWAVNVNSRSGPSEAACVLRAEDAGVRDVERLPPAPHRPTPAVGLPLLRFHPDAHTPLTLPRIPQCTLVKPSLALTSAPSHCPRIQLLHREPDPPAAGVCFVAPPVRTPRLIPPDELLRWAGARQTGVPSKLQLLQTHSVPENRSAGRRRKRREQKKNQQQEEERSTVTFRPDDSIIPPDEPAEDEPDQNDAYALPLGSCDLVGQMLLDKAMVTSAELHAFASTQKSAAEIQDAWTNTDADPPRSTTDEAVSVRPPVSPSMPSAPEGGRLDAAPLVPPDVFLSLRYSRGNSSDPPESRRPAQSSTDHSPEGRRFINVIDLTDDALVQDLPPSPPSSAQLHLLAASVVNPAHDSAPNDIEHFSAQTSGPVAVCVSPILGGDPVTLSILSSVGTSPGSLQRVMETRTQISQRLSEMDAQLVRLQKIADHMDREFASTRLLVKSIEARSPSVMSGVDLKPPSRSVRVSQEVRTSGPSALWSGAKADPERGRDEEEEEHGTSSVWSSVHQERSPLTVKPEQSRRDTDQGAPATLLENTGTRAEDTLGVSGLSDVQDILCELIRDGALSRSALDLSRTGTLPVSRAEVRPMMEEERRDLRMWMRRKQRERVTQYRRQRDERREREHRPFIPPPHTHNPTSVDLAVNRKTKEERDRQRLQEHHEQRARDACGLISDLLTAPLLLPTNPPHTLRSRSQASGRSKRIPRRPSGAPGRPAAALGKTVLLHRKSPHGPMSGRLGLHRPASALPGDRLSQVTRRGMLSDPRPRRGNKSSQRLRRVSEEDQTPDEGHAVPSWRPSEEERRIRVIPEDQLLRPGDEELTDDDLLRDLGLDLDEDLDLSPSSALSRLDWDAIERLVAEEDDDDITSCFGSRC